MIYKQLSPYAQQVIDLHSEPNKIFYTDSEMQFVNSYEMAKKQKRSILPYYLKELIPCEVFYNEAGIEKKVIGSLHFCHDGNNRWKKVLVKNEAEEIVIEVDCYC